MSTRCKYGSHDDFEGISTKRTRFGSTFACVVFEMVSAELIEGAAALDIVREEDHRAHMQHG